jgi:putative spermidine/putrescine transport system permease protein
MQTRKLKLTGVLFFVVIIIYVGNVLGILSTVILDSISKGWYHGPLPPHLTLAWYAYAAHEHNIPQLLYVTFVVAIGVALISLVIAFPAAYALGRNDFRGKGLLLSLFLLPLIVPPIAYGIPLAMVFYKFRLATRVIGVVLANLVPIVPFVILILMPFIEQVSVNLESAARMLGARRLTIFLKILVPLTLPGILTAGILSIVNTISQFPLTYLVSGAGSQTIVVALYTDAYAAGSRPMQAVDGMAVIYFLITMTCLVIALRFVSPTQMVFKIK